MAGKTTKLTSPSGAKVSVDDSKVEGLLRHGFTAEAAPTKKAAAKKSSSSTSEK